MKKYTADYDKALIFNKVHHELNQVSSTEEGRGGLCEEGCVGETRQRRAVWERLGRGGLYMWERLGLVL